MPSGALTGFKLLVNAYKPGGESRYAKFTPITEPRFTTWYNARPAHRALVGAFAATTLTSEFAMHPDYVALMDAWNAGDLAVVQNCGVLGDPQPDMNLTGKRIPLGVGAHDAFQQHHQGMTVDLAPTARGWVGAVSDLVSPFIGNPSAARTVTINSQVPISFMGQGSDTSPFYLPGAVGPSVNLTTSLGGGFDAIVRGRILAAVNVARTSARHVAWQEAFVSTVNGTTFWNPIQTTGHTGGAGPYTVDDAFEGPNPSAANWRSAFWRVARMAEDAINNRNGGLGTRMNVLMSYGDYDTHGSENGVAPNDRFTQLALDYATGLRDFREAMILLGIWNDVVVCDPTDFGRTLNTNGGAGTDHAWGYEMFVAGGKVRGKNKDGSTGLLGEYMSTIATDGTGSRDYTLGGITVPSNSLEQVYDDILDWFGLTEADRNIVMVNRPRFSNFLNVMAP
jgi:uncharacterized protein (DUF1501 family)